jgi:hypothetical protein
MDIKMPPPDFIAIDNEGTGAADAPAGLIIWQY